MKKTFNVSVGVLGHVDSGKTTLSERLSAVASTACFDKNPQSRERGITIDLGFSSFTVDLAGGEPPVAEQELDPALKERFDAVQFTLVDCPGHASLIRTIMGGAQIIDLMMLVVDSTKGIQTQTAECLVIGEILADQMIVVLNKVDLLPAPTDKSLAKVCQKLRRALQATKFRDAPMVAVSAGDPAVDAGLGDLLSGSDLLAEQGVAAASVNGLKRQLLRVARPARPDADAPFLFAIDHCFAIKGQGTVVTGTVLSGSIAVGNTIEFPLLKVEKKIKSMQMFRRPVQSAHKGDRLGLCVTQFPPESLERGLACSPGAVPVIDSFVAVVDKVRFHKQPVATGAKFHVTLGHETVLGLLTFMTCAAASDGSGCAASSSSAAAAASVVSFDHDHLFEESLEGGADGPPPSRRSRCLAFVRLQHPIPCPPGSAFIGSKLDADVHANVCRIAFQGRVLDCTVPAAEAAQRLRVYKPKVKCGHVDRLVDDRTLVGRNLFQKDSRVQVYQGLTVHLVPAAAAADAGQQPVAGADARTGTIAGAFGKTGKFKVLFMSGHGLTADSASQWRLELRFKKFVNQLAGCPPASQKSKKITQ